MQRYNPRSIDFEKLEWLSTSKEGYVTCRTPKSHPFCKSPSIALHRLVIEKEIGRCLTPEEVVHHVDANPSNNQINNLKIYGDNRDHLRLGHSSRIKQYPKLYDKEWLILRYIEQIKPMREIAEEIGCSTAGVNYALKKLNIPKRNYTINSNRPKKEKLLIKKLISLTKNNVKFLNCLSKKQEISVSELIRRIIDYYKLKYEERDGRL